VEEGREADQYQEHVELHDCFRYMLACFDVERLVLQD
jgi:hypothetical protein